MYLLCYGDSVDVAHHHHSHTQSVATAAARPQVHEVITQELAAHCVLSNPILLVAKGEEVAIKVVPRAPNGFPRRKSKITQLMATRKINPIAQ